MYVEDVCCLCTINLDPKNVFTLLRNASYLRTCRVKFIQIFMILVTLATEILQENIHNGSLLGFPSCNEKSLTTAETTCRLHAIIFHILLKICKHVSRILFRITVNAPCQDLKNTTGQWEAVGRTLWLDRPSA